jgi:hypothetical protein
LLVEDFTATRKPKRYTAPRRAEVAQLIAAASNLYHRTILTTIYSTGGLRRAELCRLKVSDIDSKRMMLRVIQDTGGIDREVPLSRTLMGVKCYKTEHFSMPDKAVTVKRVTARLVGEEDLHLIYKIEGPEHEVDIFDLSRALESIGQVLQEGARIVHPEISISLKVAPFEPGSFIADIAMIVHQNPEAGIFAAFATQPEIIKQAKEVLEYIGLIKKAGEYGASLLELLQKLKNGKPEKVEKKADSFEYKAQDGSIIPVSAPVNNLYNNGTVNNFILNIAAPAERTDVEAVKTFLKNMEAATGVQITKGDVPAIRAYAEPPVSDGRPKVVENTSVYILNPKSGNYGETKGLWTFKIAGTSRTIRAKITDKKFLSNYINGVIRFYAQDLLTAKVYEKQRLDGSKVKAQNEIIEVIEYRQAHPAERR